MTTESVAVKKSSYHHLYNFLTVLNEEQITKLRRVVTGSKNLDSFTETEILELEVKLKEKGRK